MSLSTAVGAEANLLDQTPEHAHQLIMSEPLLTNMDLEKLRQVDHDVFCARTLDATWPVAEGVAGLKAAMERLCSEADQAIADDVNIIVLSDRAAGRERVPVPALLATAGVHHHLVRKGTRLRCGLVVESGEPREVHHFCCLIGYGASAVNPYLVFETLQGMIDEGRLPGVDDIQTAQHNLIKAAGKGILKTISKMGISTVRSYCGAQIFEAVGLDESFVEQYFTGTTSRIGGIGLDVLAVEALRRHRRAFPEIRSDERVPVGGYRQGRRFGGRHMWCADVVASLRAAPRSS